MPFVPLKIQKILAFIPFVNMGLIVFWVICQIYYRHSIGNFIKRFFIMMGLWFILMVPRIVADVLMVDLITYDVILYSTLYMQTLLVAFTSILSQKSIIKKSQDRQNQSK